MLVVLGGLPGTGKTTIGMKLAELLAATYLRIDEIEHALGTALGRTHEVGSAGYRIAYALARSNLRLGNTVIADCVNPVAESREAWRKAARECDCPILEVELVCSDAAEHRRRIEMRTSDIPGFDLPGWSSVLTHDYTGWSGDWLTIDTARLSVAEAVRSLHREIRQMLAEA